jgi:hypothetical protein
MVRPVHEKPRLRSLILVSLLAGAFLPLAIGQGVALAPDPLQYVPTARGKKIAENTRRLKLELTNAHEMDTRPMQRLETGVLGDVEPYDRVAEVSPAVASFALETDGYDGVIVRWKDAAGKPRAVLLDKERTGMRTLQ